MDPNLLNSVANVLFCLMLCFFANRIYAKLVISRKIGWDDRECASKHSERTQTRLTVGQSNMHQCFCNATMATSAQSFIDIIAALFNRHVHCHTLEYCANLELRVTLF